MMALRSVACVGLLLAAAAVCAGSGASPQSVLVLLDSLDQEASFGRFLQGLRDTGYSLDVRRISDPSLQLKDWDEWRYTKIAILASGSQRERRPAKLPASQQNGRQEPTCARLAASSLAAPASAADCLTPPVGIAELGGTADAAQLASFVDEGGDLLLALSPAAPDELRAPRLSTGDVTPERLQALIAEHGERMTVLSDEPGIFQILAGQYSGGVANIDAFLQSHSGAPFRVDRAGREAHVDRPALSFGLMIQPGILAELAGVRRFRDSGLLARFLFVIPESLVGMRDVRSRVGIPPALRDEWEQLIFALLPRTDPAPPGAPTILDLSDEARELWLVFSEKVERNQGDGGRFESISDWSGKLPGAVARIAALLELAQSRGEARTVGADCMRRAVRLASLLIPHAEAAFRLLGADAVEDDARALMRISGSDSGADSLPSPGNDGYPILELH